MWSPQSNLRRYGASTNVAVALSLGIAVGLGADWRPSGSPSLLDEAQVADRVLRLQGSRVTPKRLGAGSPATPAVAPLDGQLGRIRPGVPADLVVLSRHPSPPWLSVVRSDRRSVELVVLGGDVAYGRREWVEALAGPTEREPVIAWGKDLSVDLVYSVMASPHLTSPPRLGHMRAELLARHPNIGPIFA